MKRMPSKSDFRLWQATYFSTKNPINKLAMNNRRLLIAAEFHFVHPTKKGNLKTSQVHTDSVSFSCQSKQVSRCCLNFPHEDTCEILTNQSTKIGRRAWPWWENSKATVFPARNSWLNFRVRGPFKIKIWIVWHIKTTYVTWIKKNKLEPAIIWKLVTCQRITSKNTQPRWVGTWAGVRSRDYPISWDG